MAFVAQRLSVVIILFVLACVAEPLACHAAEGKQQYGEWQRYADPETKAYYFACRFYFEPAPGQSKANWVVWYPTQGDFGYYYYSNDKASYWCRALNNQHPAYKKEQPAWNVITANNNKLPQLAAIPQNAWSGAQHPVLPGSGMPGIPMLPPPPPPVAEYKLLVAGTK